MNLLHDHRCESIATICAVEALRAVGGYTKIAEAAMEDVAARLDDNPRIEQQLSSLRTRLRLRLPDIRHSVQALLTRSSMESAPRTLDEVKGADRTPLPYGSHPEVELRAPEMRFVGRADLLTIRSAGVEITDYKSGARDAKHAEQLQTYALLWTRDRDLNPSFLPVDRLTLAYATADERVPVPSESELADLESVLQGRIERTEELMDRRPPPAYPSVSTCMFCPVRHLCDDYWLSASTATSAGRDEFGDCEAIVVRANGPRSWSIDVLPGGRHGMLIAGSECVPFGVGDRLRLLDVGFVHDHDTGDVTVSMSQSSELYVLRTETPR